MNEMTDVSSAYFHQVNGMGQVRQLAEKSAETSPFAHLLKDAQARSGNLESQKQEPDINEAAKQMEVQLTMLMLKTMEETSTEGGLLGKKFQGMGYFRDVFFESVAENMVENSGMGFAQSLQNTYGVKGLAP
jgi:Rod binding domain-containing protein